MIYKAPTSIKSRGNLQLATVNKNNHIYDLKMCAIFKKKLITTVHQAVNTFMSYASHIQ